MRRWILRWIIYSIYTIVPSRNQGQFCHSVNIWPCQKILLVVTLGGELLLTSSGKQGSYYTSCGAWHSPLQLPPVQNVKKARSWSISADVSSILKSDLGLYYFCQNTMLKWRREQGTVGEPTRSTTGKVDEFSCPSSRARRVLPFTCWLKQMKMKAPLRKPEDFGALSSTHVGTY